jgi:hypothetical protein
MRKYYVYLSNWDFDTTDTIIAENATKAKGVFIKKNLNRFLDGWPKSRFFQSLRAERIL